MNDFDAIIVGSSPVLLLEALVLESQGYSVAILEKAAELGGAWHTQSIWGHTNVETGCHYIERSDKTYRLLNQFLDLQLQPLPRHFLRVTNAKPSAWNRPQMALGQHLVNFVEKNRFIPYDFYILLSNLAKREWAEAQTHVNHLLKKRPFLYPTQGCSGIMDALLAKVAASSITVLLNTPVSLIESAGNGEQSLCHTEAQIYRSRWTITGQHVAVSMKHNCTPLLPERYPIRIIHVVIHLQGVVLRTFGHLGITNSPLIRQITDVTTFARKDGHPLNENQLILCCKVWAKAFDQLT